MRLILMVGMGACLCHLTAHAAFDQHNKGARSSGMGNASVGLEDFWAICNNQAGLARLGSATIGLCIQNHFLVRQLNQGCLGFAVPTRKAGVLGLVLDDFGTNTYRENVIGLAYAKAIGQDLSVGIRLNYLKTSYGGDYRDKSCIGFDLGLLYRIRKSLTIAFHSSNPLSFYIPSSQNERLDSRLALGLAHQISDEIMLTAECEKVTGRKPRFKTGIEYVALNKAYIRAGILSSPFQVSFGFGYALGHITFNMASTYHRFLGFSPQLSVNYTIGKKSGR